MRISDWSSDVCSSDLRLDQIKARVPHMTLVTTGQRKGADAIAAAWAARPENSVPLVAYGLYGSGRKTAFNRNRKLAELKPVEALLCEGWGLPANIYKLLRKAGVPIPAFKKPEGVARPAVQRGTGQPARGLWRERAGPAVEV